MTMFGHAFGGMANSMRRNLHHSDVVLDDTNYLPLKLTIKRILDGLRILGHTDGTSALPVAPYLPNAYSSFDVDDDVPPSISPVLLEAFERKSEKWYADDSSAKMVICQTVTPGIRTQIVELPTAHVMCAYLARRYYGSSQAQLYTLYQTLVGL